MAKVNECLGISLTSSYIRYAKVSKDSNNFSLKQYGIKFIKDTIKDTIYEIISETNSKEISVAISTPNPIYKNINLFKHISNMDVGNAIKLEFDDWCEQNNVMPDKYHYISFLSDLAVGDYKSGVLAIEDRGKIEEYSAINDIKMTSMYPVDILSNNIVSKDLDKYILVNFDEELTIMTIINNKINTINHYNVGMKDVFEKFTDVLGSFSKSYETCKKINVFNGETSTTNKVQLEELLEPILQNILNVCSEVINKYKSEINKILLTGSATLFTNIDTLFSEFFNVKAELLKPNIITEGNNIKNMAEVIEVNSAISIAIECLNPSIAGVSFINQNLNKLTKATTVLNMFNNKKKNVVNKEFNVDRKILENFVKYAMYPIIVLGTVPIAYFALSNIYVNMVNGLNDNIIEKANEYDIENSKINDDILYISSSRNSYKEINDNIDSLVKQIENNEIGKFTTYNVAAFMQKLIVIMPKNVKLLSVSSDDNKHVTISAQAEEYPAIGYFTAALRTRNDILRDIKVNKINNGSVIVVEIGGELP